MGELFYEFHKFSFFFFFFQFSLMNSEVFQKKVLQYESAPSALHLHQWTAQGSCFDFLQRSKDQRSKIKNQPQIPIEDSLIAPHSGLYKVWFSNERAWWSSLTIQHSIKVSRKSS